MVSPFLPFPSVVGVGEASPTTMLFVGVKAQPTNNYALMNIRIFLLVKTPPKGLP